VVAWEQESFSLIQFIRRWGVLGLVPSLAALVLWWAVLWVYVEKPLVHPLTTAASILFSQLVLILLYVNRLFWRERWWATQVYRTAYPPLTLAIGGTAAISVILGVVSAVLYHRWKVTADFWKQLIFASAYVPTYMFATASLTLLAIHDYLDRLDQRVPPPIFVHTERLLRVAVEAALQGLSVLNGKQGAAAADSDGHMRGYQILEVVRIPETGGIRVLLRRSLRPAQPAAGDSPQLQPDDKTWSIEADRWGRLQSLRPGTARTD